MTDNEIIKALECCSVAFDCPDCPFECDCGSMQNLSTAAIDLINRLKADKEALIAGQESLMTCIAKKKETLAELDAEVERLRENNQKLYEEMVERQKEEVAIAKRMGKSEAIKEFREEYKDHILHKIRNCPTADVVEVKHGEWIWTENGEADYEQFWVCSVCKEKSYIKTKFCSDCGAKMDGERRDT